MNVQYAIQGDEIYVLEVNPRASRTVPFVAKAIGLPVAAIAARVMAGETLKSFNLKTPNPDAHLGQGSGAALRPLPRRRHDPGPGDALDRRSDGPGHEFRPRLRQEPDRRRHRSCRSAARVFISVKDADKDLVDRARRASWSRWAFDSSPRAARRDVAARQPGCRSRTINKVLEGRPHVVDALKNGEIHLVFNTTDGAQALADSLVDPADGADPESSLLHDHGGGRGGHRRRIAALRGRGSLEVAPLQSYSL